jgi:protein involved in polysaccharide export with SLBB domain
MKSAFSAIAIKFVLVFVLIGVVSVDLGAQTSWNRVDRTSTMENGMRIQPYGSYAEFALDMLLNQIGGRGLDISVDPDQYIVGPGDQFGISFVSGDIGDIHCRVGLDGGLFIKSVGSIDVSGLTLGEAIESLGAAISKNFSGAGYNVQLTDFRFIRLNIIGQVARPGLYYVPAIWRASEAIDLAGGVTSEASLRRIRLMAGDRQFPVDLVRFDAVGDDAANPMVCDGRTLMIPGRLETDQYISISGLVNQPGMFTAVDGDKLSDYMAYARGVRGDLTDMTILISSTDGKITNRLDGADKAALDFIPAPGDNISLVWKEGRQRFGYATIMGEVARPGQYPLENKNFSLRNLLELCGGITAGGCGDMIRIYRLMPETPMTDYSMDQTLSPGDERVSGRQLLSYNPRHPLDFSELTLQDGDSIYIPAATGMVAVTGAVVSPGLIGFQPGKSVDYYLDRAGGLGFDADRARMVVVNPATGGGISAEKAGELFDGETLFVPRKDDGTKP